MEGAGGLHVPLNETEDMLDLMQAIGLPVVLVVANRLGCLNHARLSLEAMQLRGIDVAGMVLIRILPDTQYDAGCGAEAQQADEERILDDNVTSLKRMGEQLGVPLLADIPYLGNPLDREALLSGLQPCAARLQEKLDEQLDEQQGSGKKGQKTSLLTGIICGIPIRLPQSPFLSLWCARPMTTGLSLTTAGSLLTACPPGGVPCTAMAMPA